jgi:hypothetical protein
MLKSRWIIAVALGLTITSALGQTKEQAENTREETEEQQSPPTLSIASPLSVEIVEDQSAAQARQRREEESRQTEIADLAAQQGMNVATQSIERATRDMRDYAFYSTIAVWAGTVLLILTLVLSWMANRAAQAAVRVTREIGRAQATSYLVMEYVITRPSNAVILAEYSVKNVGITPSQQTEMTIKVRPNNVSGPKDADPFSKTKKISLDAIAGGATSQSFVMFSSREDPEFFAAWPPREGIIVVADVEIIWSDVFGEQHRAWFFMANRDSVFDKETNENGFEYDQKMYTTRSTFTKLGRPQKNKQ